MTSAVFFEEKQTNPPWMGWIVVIIGVVMLVFILFDLVRRWNDPSHPDTAGLLAGAAGIVLVVGVVAWLAFSNHLAVSIDRQGISYVFVPTFWKPKRIDADQLESYELRKITFSELTSAQSKNTYGQRDKKKEVCVILGRQVVDLRLRDGRQVILGTRNPDGMVWALKRLQNRG